jgi:glycosyltransferase involved in cell wall biosynthesis
MSRRTAEPEAVAGETRRTVRVLYLTMNPNRASTTVPTEGWFRFLPALGLEPVLVSHQAGAFHEWVTDNSFPAYHVRMPLPQAFGPTGLAVSLARLSRIVIRHRIDLVHANEQDIYPAGYYLARLFNLPIVVSIHSTMTRGQCEWTFGRRRPPDRIFFVSNSFAAEMAPALRGVVSDSRSAVLHNGVDLHHFAPDALLGRQFRETHAIGSGPVIGVACALRPGKQLEHLFEAAARLDDAGLRVVIAGGPVPGDELYAVQVIKHGKALLGKRLLHFGHLDELRGFYNSLDVCVNTSKQESFGISVLQAMACGCPVVGYPSGAVAETVLPNGGEITPQDRVDQLSSALGRWITDPAKRAVASRDARLRASRFDIRSLSHDLWEEYLRITTPAHPA